jgi:hypothetical protein
VTLDQEIYQKIASYLVDGNYFEEGFPLDAVTIEMKAELVPENDVCEFWFNYINKEHITNITDLNGVAYAKILDLLVELRQFFQSQNQPYWKGCEFKVDLETGKFSIEFIYD